MNNKTLLFLFFSIVLINNSYSTSIQKDSLFQKLKAELKYAIKSSNKSLIAKSNYELGVFYFKNNLNATSISHLNVAINYTKSTDTLSNKIKNLIGSIHLSMKNFVTATSYISEALFEAQKINYKNGEATSYGLLGSIYEKQKNYLKALEVEQKSLSIFSSLKKKTGIAKTYENIGSIYEDLNQFDKAHSYFLSAYDLLKNTQTFNEVVVLNNLGDTYRKQANYTKAISYTNKALKIATALNNSDLLESAYKDLSKTYFLLGEYKKAYQYRLKSEEYNEITLKNQNAKQLNILQAVYESENKETEIQLLKEKNNVSSTHKKLLLVSLLGLLLILVIVSYFFNKRRKTNKKIQQYKQQILKAELKQKQIKEEALERNVKQKTASLSKYSLHLSQKNKILTEISSQLKNIVVRDQINYKKIIQKITKEIDFNLKQESEWEEFNELFNNIHPDFSIRLTKIATKKLSPAELKLSMLLRLNLSSKEIASILRVTPDSVRVARHRLRKKLPINSKQELINFMLEV